MKCVACGYNEERARDNLKYVKDHNLIVFMEEASGLVKPFIEIHGCTKGKDRVFRGKVCRKPSVKLYACPNCGTVKMEPK